MSTSMAAATSNICSVRMQGCLCVKLHLSLCPWVRGLVWKCTYTAPQLDSGYPSLAILWHSVSVGALLYQTQGIHPIPMSTAPTQKSLCLREISGTIFMSSRWSNCRYGPITFSIPYSQIADLNLTLSVWGFTANYQHYNTDVHEGTWLRSTKF